MMTRKSMACAREEEFCVAAVCKGVTLGELWFKGLEKQTRGHVASGIWVG